MSNKLSIPNKVGSVSLSAKRMASSNTVQDYTNFANKIALVFDDSGSMSGQDIIDAREAVNGYVSALNIADSAVAIYPLNKAKQPLTNIPGLIFAYVMGIEATGGTPIYAKLGEILLDNTCNHAIIFSDGAPTDDDYNRSIEKFKARGIKIDTVYIGGGESIVLKGIAEATGGVYLHFTDASIFKTGLKYLAPKFRAMLTSGDFKERLEKGQI